MIEIRKAPIINKDTKWCAMTFAQRNLEKTLDVLVYNIFSSLIIWLSSWRSTNSNQKTLILWFLKWSNFNATENCPKFQQLSLKKTLNRVQNAKACVCMWASTVCWQKMVHMPVRSFLFLGFFVYCRWILFDHN